MQTTLLALNEVARHSRTSLTPAAPARPQPSSFEQMLRDSGSEALPPERSSANASAETDTRPRAEASDALDAELDAVPGDGDESTGHASAEPGPRDVSGPEGHPDPGTGNDDPVAETGIEPVPETGIEPVSEDAASATVAPDAASAPNHTSDDAESTAVAAAATPDPVLQTSATGAPRSETNAALSAQTGSGFLEEGAPIRASSNRPIRAAAPPAAAGAESNAARGSREADPSRTTHRAPAGTRGVTDAAVASHQTIQPDGSDARHGGAGVPSASGTEGPTVDVLVGGIRSADAAMATTIAPNDAAATRAPRDGASTTPETTPGTAPTLEPSLATKLEANADTAQERHDQRPATPAQARALQVDASIRAEGAPSFNAHAPASAIAAGAERVMPAPTPGVASGASASTAVAQLVGAHGGDAAEAPAAQRIVRGLSAMVNQRGGAMTMRLSPPALGNLRIQMTMVQGSVSAQFTATTPEAQSMLNRSLPMLRAALESHGLQVERLGVQLSGSSDGAPQTRADANAQQTMHQDGGPRQDAAEGESRGRRDDGATGGNDQNDQGQARDFAERLEVEAFRADDSEFEVPADSSVETRASEVGDSTSAEGRAA